jgi:hypothetical protein
MHKERVFLLLCPAAVFLSAFLLFLIEPLVAKMILPWFGGSAAVWATCLVFFQSALLLGYYYADRTSRWLSPKRQAEAHIVLLALSLSFLPLLSSAGWRPHPGTDPAWRIVWLLTATIGLPFFLLSATSPLMQTWFQRLRPKADPYYLFSLSNLASFLALLAYPFLLEPRISTSTQAAAWSASFALFVPLCATAAFLSRAGAPDSGSPVDCREQPLLRRRLHWLALSACGSMLLLTVTSHLTQNVAPVPLLWVLPLAFYLLTFTLVFSRRQFYSRWLFVRLLAVFLTAMGYEAYDSRGIGAVQIVLPLFCLGLFVCCMFCHGELNRLKPEGKALTSFYLMLSLGGALGAMFVGLAAPRLFSSLYEFPLTLLLTGLLALITLWPEGWAWRTLLCSVSVGLAFVLVLKIQSLRHQSIVMVRNFYGALRVTESSDGGQGPARVLYHGIIQHGAQFRNLPWRKVPVAYYGFNSGVGLALQFCCENSSKRVGVIGLGTGTLAAYGRPGDFFRFYEINPEVARIADSLFTYLRDSPAHKEITMGDARLSLQSEAPQQFDVLAVDAFSGDAIPVHLLTEEAISLYLRHLKPNGILAIHASNTFLVLDAVVKQLADRFGYPAKRIENEGNENLRVAPSEWVLVSRNSRFMTLSLVTKQEQPIHIPAGLRPWTDDHNNLFQILRPLKVLNSRADR